MKRAVVLSFLIFLTACTATKPQTSDTSQSPTDSAFVTSDISESQTEETEMKMKVQIGERTFTASMEDSAAARELFAMAQDTPLSVEMRDYSGFEKVGSLGKALTADDRQTTAAAGDIVLYNGDKIVMFYGSNSWSYTRLGHIDDLNGWDEALGGGNITAVFSAPK